MSRRRGAVKPRLEAVEPASPNWPAHAWRIAALWLLCALAYSNSFSTGFVLDNRPIILEDARVHSVSAQNVSRIFSEDYWASRSGSVLYRPLTTLSYLFNFAVLGNGDRPEGYHWINFLLHGLNATLVYLLAFTILGRSAAALAMAAVWGGNPVLTESVTNIIGRADLLAGFGVIAGILCYLKGRSATGKRLSWLMAVGAAQAIGIFSKESAIALIGLMALVDLAWPAGEKPVARLPFYSVAAAVSVAFLTARPALQQHIGVQFIDNPLVGASFLEARLTAMKVLLRYLWLFVWPLNLSADYSFNAIAVNGWWDGWAALLLAGSIVGLFRIRRSQPSLFFFAGFFLITLFPVSNLPFLIGTIMAERFAYLPFVGLAGCLVIGLEALSQRTGIRQLTWAAAGVICLLFAIRTYGRNPDWQTDASLWTKTVEVVPQSAKAHLNLGAILSETPDRIEDSVAEYKIALRIKPDYALAQYGLGTALAKIPGRAEDAIAIAHFRSALKLQPNNPQAHNNLGNLLAKSPERLAAAVAEYRAALQLDPNYAEARVNLANALSSMPGGTEEAIAEYRAVLRIAPDMAGAHYNLGIALGEAGRWADATAEFRLAIQAQPDLAAAHRSLGVALAKLGQLGEALQELEAAYRIQPDPSIKEMIDQARGRTP
jgi:protein O-mannosyl-transferase